MIPPDESLELKPGTPVLILRAHRAVGSPEDSRPAAQPPNAARELAEPWVTVEACVERVDDELLWLTGAAASFKPGEVVLLDVSVSSDARYRAAFEVEVASAALCAQGELVWQRVQQRALVRIDLPKLPVHIHRCESPGAAGDDAENASTRPDRPARTSAAPHSMVDLSAGGMRIVANSDFAVGEEVICDFELPDQPAYSMPSRVVRVDSLRKLVSLKFTNPQEALFSRILRWVFREQVRQHRQAVRRTKTQARDA